MYQLGMHRLRRSPPRNVFRAEHPAVTALTYMTRIALSTPTLEPLTGVIPTTKVGIKCCEVDADRLNERSACIELELRQSLRSVLLRLVRRTPLGEYAAKLAGSLSLTITMRGSRRADGPLDLFGPVRKPGRHYQ